MSLLRKSLLASLVLWGLFACYSDHLQPYPRPAAEVPPRLNAAKYNDTPIVLMISIDGFRADYFKKYAPPILTKLAEQGVRSEGLVPSFPSLTFPNHITLITGRKPGHHGIVSNYFYDAERKASYQMTDGHAVNDGTWYHGEPVWEVAEKEDMRTASCFWVGSEANIGGVSPTFVRPFDDSVTNQQRADQVIQWLRLPEAQRPHFITLYFSDVDHQGHAFGPDSKEVNDALQDIDSAIGSVVQEVRDKNLPVQFVVVSDHGMMPITEKIDINPMTDLKDFIVMEKGAVTHLYSTDPAKIEKAYTELKSHEKNFKVYKPSELPVEWAYQDLSRIGDIILVAEPGTYLTKLEAFTPPQDPNAPNKGSVATHGWDPKTPEMRGLFIAQGSLIKKNMTVGLMENVNVYPFVLELLKLKAHETNDGDFQAVTDMLAASSTVAGKRK